MRDGCRHTWEEVSRSFTPGIRPANMNGTLDALQALLAGQTHVEMRCSQCGDLKSVSLMGDHPPHMEES